MQSMTTASARETRHVEEFKAEYRKYADAARGVFMVRTREPQRLIHVLQDLTVEDETEFRLWKCNTGWRAFPRPDNSNPNLDIRKPRDTDIVPGSIDIGKAMLTLKPVGTEVSVPPGVLAMMHPHHAFDKPLVHQHIKDFSQFAIENAHRAVFIVPETAKLPIEIEDDVQILDFKTPSHAELVGIWNQLTKVFEGFEEAARVEFDEDEVNILVQNAVGMTQYEFEQACSIAALNYANLVEAGMEAAAEADEEYERPNPDVHDFVRIVLDSKVEIFRQTEMLELMHPGSMDEVGGFDLLKTWMAQRAEAYTPEAEEFGIAAPKGVLCVGPPGSGKSLFAKAVAGVFNTPLVKFDMGKVYNKYVGDSEANVRVALKMVESAAPCVLLIDEIDKQFSTGGGSDGGVSQRVLGTFLTWMNDRDSRKAPVFVVMTANNVTNMPPEIIRKGRVDEIFACTFPNLTERMEILKIHLNKRGHEMSDLDLRKVSENTNNFVGSEIEAIVVEGLIEAFTTKQKQVPAALLVKHAGKIKPLSETMREAVTFMNEWAKANAREASSGVKFDDNVAKDGPVRVLQRPNGLRRPVKPGKTQDV